MPEEIRLEDRIKEYVPKAGSALVGTFSGIAGSVYAPKLIGSVIGGSIIGIPTASILLGTAGVVAGGLAGYYAFKGLYHLGKKAYDKISELRLEEKVLNYASRFDEKASKIIPGLGAFAGGSFLAGAGVYLSYAAGIIPAILSGVGGLALGAILGYLALNTTYKLTRDIIKTTYNTIFHPIKTWGATKTGRTKVSSAIRKVFSYMFSPASKKAPTTATVVT